MSDRLAAELARIRESDTAGIRGHPWIDDVPRLLAALEAVLKLAAEWAAEAPRLDEMADRAAGRGALPERTSLISARAQSLEDHARGLRESISRALLGKGAP